MSEFESIFGYSLADLFAAVIAIGIILGVFLLIYRCSAPVVNKYYNKYVSNNMAIGANLHQYMKNPMMLALMSDSPKNSADTVKAFTDTASKKSAKNGIVPNGESTRKLKLRNRHISTSEESVPESSEFTDERSSRSTTDCDRTETKTFTTEKESQIQKKPATDASETEAEAMNDCPTNTGLEVVTMRKRRKIHTWIKRGFHHCYVCHLGGVLELPFCVARFPVNAVSSKAHLRFILPEVQHDNGTIVLIPPIYCSRMDQSRAITFKEPVKFKIEISDTKRQVLCDGEKVELQVTECSVNIKWITAEFLTIEKAKEYVSFKIMRLAGFRVICRNPSNGMNKLFYTLCVKRFDGCLDPFQHYMFVVIHSADEVTCREAERVSSEWKNVAPKQMLLIRSPCTFKATVTPSRQDINPGESGEYRIENHSEPILKYLCVQLCKKKRDVSISSDERVHLDFSVFASGARNGTMTGLFPFQWSTECPAPPTPQIINVYGKDAVGIQVMDHAAIGVRGRRLPPSLQAVEDDVQ